MNAFLNGTGGRGPSVRAGLDLGPAQREQVDRWRAMRFSWDRIAANFGCSAHDVRRAFDTGYEAGRVVVPAPAPPPPDAPVVSALAESLKKAPGKVRVLGALLESTAPLGRHDLAKALGIVPGTISNHLSSLTADYLICRGQAGYVLTSEGRRVAQTVARAHRA